MHTLHTKAAAIFTRWAQEAETAQATVDTAGHGSVMTTEEIDAGTSALWMTCWCPLLQGEASHFVLFFCYLSCYFFIVVHGVCCSSN